MLLDLMSPAGAISVEEQAKHACGPSLRRNPVYLFACHLEWCNERKLEAYQELIAALDDSDENIRKVAESLLHRSSPRRRTRSPVHSDEW